MSPYYPPGGGGSSNSAGLAGTGNYYIVGSSTPGLPNSKIITAGSSITTHTDSTSFYINAITNAGSSIVYASTGAYYLLSSGNSTLPNSFRIGLNTSTSNLLWMNSAAFIPQVLTIADSAVLIAPANSGNHFRVTLVGNRTLGNPTVVIDGQKSIQEQLTRVPS